jgi:hypothetical protein
MDAGKYEKYLTGERYLGQYLKINKRKISNYCGGNLVK